MKRSVFLLALFSLLALTTSVQANDYLEQSKHYTVMSMGNGVLRFYVPIWVYGRGNDYYLEGNNDFSSNDDSYIWYSTASNASRGNASVHRIASVSAARYGKNDTDGDEGEGYIYIHEGSAIIRSTYNGEPIVLQAGDSTYWHEWKKKMSLKRKEDDDHKRITYFIFDWYPPASLQNTVFYWGVSANIYKKSSGESKYKKWWNQSEKFTGNKTPQTPELFTPYIYALDETGTSGYGCAAVQFTVYQEPISYHTSLNSQEIALADRSSTIVVPTKDSVQRFFSGYFNVKIDDGGNTQVLKSNEVHIPAYHRIYDFGGAEVLDAQQSVTGQVDLTWTTRCPDAKDLVEGDVFEVQRATKEDFSDAKTIDSKAYQKGTSDYHVSDNPLEALGTDTSAMSSETQYLTVRRTVMTYDNNGNPYAAYYVRLGSTKVMYPGRKFYYRVRRASSAIWGWDHEFAQTAEVMSQDYLAPLAETQANYTLDPNYATNKKVHFNVRLDNQTVTPVPEPESECSYSASISRVNVEEFPVRIKATRDNSVGGTNPSEFEFVLEITKGNAVENRVLPITMYDTYYASSFPADAERVRLVVKDKTNGKVLGANDANLDMPYVKTAEMYYRSGEPRVYFDYEASEFNRLKDSVDNAYPLNHDSVRHVLYQELQQQIAGISEDGTPRCQWDKNALLYLRQTLVETGETIDYVIPQDSIKRNADGSWNAHMTVVANRACVHYQYSVRLDQTYSLLKVINPDQLKPKTIQGPDLFYNEVADIARLDASDGDDRYSVLLTWEPTPGGVDEYILGRREAESNAVYDTLTTTVETDYRDRTAVPGQRYEYELTARYTCNNTTTTHSATTTGHRSPYGLISGRVQYADGTGCPGISVGLTANGEEANGEWTAVTDGAGYYRFDSLLYGAGKDYSVTPTSSHAEFRFNSSSAATASIRLSADNPVADAVAFENISSVRFSGRVLYSNSTIPVRDAYILLNGQVVKTANGVLHTDQSGNFELLVPKGQAFTLQIAKEGHTFEGEGFVRIDGSAELALDKPLDGVRVWDATKVRLAGRVVGGKVQAEKPLGFGLSTNNLGKDLQLVLELEGDNISQIVRDRNDLTRDTFEYTVQHEVKGTTQVHYQRKRIIINPDPETGEFFADLFPVKYKITQATARGYSTLFAEGKTSEVMDLSDAAKTADSVVYNNQTAHFNSRFDITYRSPISISCIQMRYGMPLDFYGDQTMIRQNILNQEIEVPLVEYNSRTEAYHYMFGAPVFSMGNYRFRITAHEDYYYNNEPTGRHEEVRIKGGTLKVYNGLHDAMNTQTVTTPLNEEGQAEVTIPVDYVSFLKTGEQALRVLDLSVETDGKYIEQEAFRAYIAGNKAKGRNFLTTVDAGVNLLDVLRDPPGSNSYAYIEKGTTYKYNYSFSFNGKFGIEIDAKYGTGNSINIGSYAGVPGSGIYAGQTMTTSVSNSFAFPITFGVYYKKMASYTFTTTERIETSTDNMYVGSKGDIYIGTTQTAYFGLTDAVKPLDSLTYASLLARTTDNAGIAGSIHTVAEGCDLKGNKYYLVIGEETEAGATVSGTFAYTQDYIVNTMLPKLIRERNALLVTGDSLSAQKIANARNDVVYWSKVPEDADEYALSSYVKLYPNGKNTYWIDIDRVKSYNNQIKKWIDLIHDNEYEKLTLMKGVNADQVGNYSVSGGVKTTHSETYDYSSTISYRWDCPNVIPSANSIATEFGSLINGVPEKVANMITNFVDEAVWDADNNAVRPKGKDPMYIDGTVPGAKWTLSLKPIVDIKFDRDPNETEEHKKTAGFVLQTDPLSSMNVTVMRLREPKNLFNVESDTTREWVDNGNDYDGDSYQYGSYVYVLNGGATKCPWEGPEEAIFYEVGGQPAFISYGTARLENPKIDMTAHERSDVPHDKPAVFQVRMANEVEDDISGSARPVVFKLKVDDNSNQKGATILMDGMPLTGAGREIKFSPGEIINKTIEVYAGEDYDYEDITLMLLSSCDLKMADKTSFSVHYMPVSCEVNIAAPHDKWVMNTLSPQDSAGYYMPVVIDGFDVNYKGFDHIELQYKLSKQSDDAWVNLCSYYADSTYYNQASGSKAMIRGGRIENIRFYGERDPMEQLYDLRAVSFCRHGSSFITRTSAVRSGTKDTRVPRVFGVAQPADAILGVGDNLMLRFNEPIAGNYLDEDNNFQIVGTTNATGITTGTSLHFQQAQDSKAATQVERSLTNKSFTIDMVVRPANTMMPGSLFVTTMPSSNYSVQFGYGEGRLVLFMVNEESVYMFMTEANVLPSGIFSRVLAVYNNETKQVKFYIGTQEMPLSETGMSSLPSDFVLRGSAPLEFGGETETDMLEARIWSKALTQEEIAATNLKYLTGYERDLMAYYRMDEGRGNELTDRANGATLYCKATSWNHRKGISVALKADEELKLDGNLLGRSKIYDESIMLWFKTSAPNGAIFRAGRTDEKHGTLLSMENGRLMLHSDSTQWTIGDGLANNEWHHVVLTVNRTMNNAAVYVDGKVLQSFSADLLGGITGAMYLGGNGFVGNIDDICFFEQALPKYMVEGYDNLSPAGDEMGLLGYLPFEEQVLNPNGVLELVFSPNDQRVFRDANGNVVEKVVPLILTANGQQPIANADKVSYAPTRDQGLVTKMKFDWSFNGDELLININMADREINKQPIYVTVRDVEDLNGNPMASPVSWVAFVDRNALKWQQRTLRVESYYDNTEDFEYFIDIINHSGRRHQYTIESLPDWLSVNEPYGTMNAQEEKMLRLRFDANLPVGVYSDQIYLTDEEGLAEPLVIEYAITADAPYDEVDRTKYPLNMSICGQVKIAKTNETVFDSDERDIVYAMYKNECVGMANISFDDMSGKSKLHLTVYGSDEMDGKQIRFQLWQASTGKVFDLSADRTITFKHGNVYGCGDGNPVQLTTNGSERQTIQLQPGWNWTSFNLDLRQYVAKMANIMTANEPWTEGDLIKNPATRHFVIWSDSLSRFTGDFDYLRYIYTYMIYCQNGNTMHISGNNLPTDSMYVPVYGGRWCAMPCLLKQVTPVTEALSDYYDLAQPGDMLKSHDHFAYFSEDRKWEGDLSVMRPGEGYLFRRLAQDTVKIRFYNRSNSASGLTAKRSRSDLVSGLKGEAGLFRNPQAATNMTMIATIEGLPVTGDGLRVYVGDELAAIAEPKDSLYYLTIQSDRVGEPLRFELNGQWLNVQINDQMVNDQMVNIPDSHYGTIKAPVVLRKDEGVGVYKIIENDHVIIIRNNERYDVTGKKL